MFWTHRWLDGQRIVDLASNIVRAVSKHCQDTRTVHEALQDSAWLDDIEGAPTSEVIMEVIQLGHMLQVVGLSLANTVWKTP